VPLLRFLRAVGAHVPKGATLALVSGTKEDPTTPFLIAVGQLPDQTVLPEISLQPSLPAPDWIACFGRCVDDARYVRAGSFEGGWLLQRRP
jgi:hypothetical protein